MTQGADFAYEWDEAKRQRTLETRNVDFADMAFFEWDTALVRTDGRRDYGEARFSLTRTYDLPMVCLWFGNQKGNITRHMRC